MVFTKEDLMDGRVWVGGWAAADADAERQLQAQGDGRPKASQGSQGSQDLHAHRLGWAGAPGKRPGCREVCEEVCSPHLDLCSTYK